MNVCLKSLGKTIIISLFILSEIMAFVAGFVAALLLGLKRRSLIEVALVATAAAYVTSLILPLF